MLTIVFLLISNIFMTFAWYRHLKYQNVPLWKVTLISWGIAFFEYSFQVPANRIVQPYLQCRTTEDDPGDHHSGGVFRIFHLVFEAGHHVELRGRIFLHRGSGVLYF